ncbi:MAG TPA: sugar phosphate isomerase/epimerase family protein [Terracidiphilus sp.]|nr:sugar phosphate isomerase/epimerase family protein [Terracidiphilus sp.]
MAEKARLSLNQMTVANWSVAEATEGCVRHGIGSIALWRHKIAEAGLDACVQHVRDAGLHVSSVCRGGMFPAPTEQERRKNIEDNFRAADEAAAFAADSLVLVVGGCAGVHIEDARKMVADGVAALVPYAHERGVRIGLEPLHPMYAADRSVLNTIGQSLEIASTYEPNEVGVILDTFHIWWDPQVAALIAQAAGRIFGFHVSDWLVPLPDVLLGRGLMGDGVIDNRKLRALVEKAGYDGPIEVEIFNRTLWDADPDTVLAQVIERFEKFV